MILKIAKKELVETLRDKRFHVFAIIIAALFIVSIFLGWQHSRLVEEQHDQAAEATRKQWLEQGEKGPHSAAHFGVYAFKPQMPLSFFDRGIEAYTGVAVWLEAHKQNDLAYRPARDQTSLARFGDLTGASILQVLIPLLVILLTFTAFAGERETGTLRQIVSLGVAPKQLAFGKILGVAAVLVILLLPAVFIGFGAMILAAEDGGLASTLFNGIALLIVYALYIGAFVSLTLAVSALASSSRMALVIMLGFWMFSCLIAPRVAADLAKIIHPTPSAHEFAAKVDRDIKNGLDGHDPADKRLDKLKASTMEKYGVNRLEDLPINFNGLALQAGEDHSNDVFDKHYGELWDTYERQNNVKRYLGVVTPILAVSKISSGLSGTDYYQHRNFASAAEDHRRNLIRIVNNDVAANSKYGDTGYMAGPELWAKVPEFTYTAPETAETLYRQRISIVILVAWFAVSVCFLLWAVSRIRVA